MKRVNPPTGNITQPVLDRTLRDYASAINDAADQRIFLFVSITGSYTAGENDHVILCAPAAATTITLPAASAMVNKRVTIKRTISATSPTITVVSTAGNIDNSANLSMNTSYASVELYSDGSNWWKI